MISERKSIVSDRKSIRSRTDISQMNLDNIKLSRSNISLSSRKRLSICTTSTIGSPYNNPNNKRLSLVNNSFNDALSVDSLHHIGHTSLIIPKTDVPPEMKRYSFNVYRNIIRVPPNSSSFVISNKSFVRNDNKSKSPVIIHNDPSIINQSSNKENENDITDNVLGELKEENTSIVQSINKEDLQLDTNGNNEKEKQRPRVEDITAPPGDVESRIEMDGEEAILDKSRPGLVVVKTPGRELMSPKNPFIKYFNGMIDSRALTITPPFVTFLEIQKILIYLSFYYSGFKYFFQIPW